MPALPLLNMRYRFYAILILLLAFAARAWMAQWVRHDFDRGYPHGLGIHIVELIVSGQWRDLPVTSLPSSVILPNPAGASYLWGWVALFDRSAYSATVVSGMLGVLSVAMTMDLTRRLLGAGAGLFAGFLHAISTFSIYYATGTWTQGLLEFSSVAVAYLVMTGLVMHSTRRVVMAGVAAAVLMQTYIVAFALMAQLVVACIAGFDKRMARAIVSCLLIAAGGLLFYGITISANPEIQSIAERFADPSKNNEYTRHPFNLKYGLHEQAVDHTARIASGRDAENAVYQSPYPSDPGIRAGFNTASNARAMLIEGMIVLGLVYLLIRSIRDRGSRMLLAWFFAPMLLITLVTLRISWLVHPFYLLISAPAGFVVAAAPLAALSRLRIAWPRVDHRLASAGVFILAAVLAAPSAATLSSYAHASQTQPFAGSLDQMPLRQLTQLGSLWQKVCSRISTPAQKVDLRFWHASVAQSDLRVHANTWRERDASSIWLVNARGGDCITPAHQAAPSFSDTTPFPVANANLTVMRAQPQGDSPALLTTNIGWSLLDAQTPAQAQAGETITVTHVWRIDSLPNEPFATWYFAPFVKLIGPDGTQLMSMDSAPALEGWAWRPGEWLISDVRFALPGELPAGAYTLELSLFDPNQKKNAVYFDPADPVTPVLALRRPVEITR